jgi:hypothetical protein
MTSIHFDPAQFVSPSEPEPRDQLIVNGRYYLPPLDDPTGKRRSLQRVTNFIKQLSDRSGLETWKLRSTVIGLARDERRYDLACSINPNSPRGKQDLDKLVEECIDLAQAGPSGGNITGTALHNLTDDVVGSYPIRVRDKWVPKLENYFAALHDKGLRVVPGLQERLVVSERYGTCGRLDDVYEDPFGTLRVGDRKSQKEFQTWWEIGAQLALYQGSDAMWNEDECRWEEMPKLADDFCHVAWMPLNHPAAQKGGSVDTVTIYDLPLEGPREVLEWCLRVRTLRTQARQWGCERGDLDDFARIARDIRDAESRDDLRKLAPILVGATGTHMLTEMAAKRWEALAEAEAPEPVSVDIEQAAFVGIPKATPAGQQALAMMQASVEHVRAMTPADVHEMLNPDDFECRFDGKRVSEHPINIPGHYHCISPQPRWIAPAPVVVAPQALTEVAPGIAVMHSDTGNVPMSVEAHHEFGRDQATLKITGTTDAVIEAGHRIFDPALFVSPAQDATFPGEGDGGGSSGPVPPAGGADLAGPALAGAAEVQRKPQDWLHHLQIEDPIPVDPDGVWCKPMSLKVFRSIYGAGLGLAAAGEDDGSEGSAEHLRQVVERAHDLDAVPLKVVKEVATRAANSKSSRGRVRLLNDVEEKKYAAHREALLPALLRQWLSADGQLAQLDDVNGMVANTGGASRAAMLANKAGSISLSEYLATKEEPKGGEATANAVRAWESQHAPDREAPNVQRAQRYEETKQGEVLETPALTQLIQEVREEDARAAASTDHTVDPALSDADRALLPTMAIGLTQAAREFVDNLSERAGKVQLNEAGRRLKYLDENDGVPLPDGTLAGDRERILPGTVNQVRQKYLSINSGPQAGKHSLARLVELAKEARDGAERAQVFRAITSYHKWTGEIAAEINQHYLDNGYATEDFDQYFEQQQIASSALPADPDDPDTVEDAIQLLEGAKTMPELQAMWTSLGSLPFFHDARLQEALMARFAKVKA